MDRGVELGPPLCIVEVADGADAVTVDHVRDGVAEGLLLGREADVHQAFVPDVRSDGVHSSRSVRRSTFPEGKRGIASTTTT